ncbi:MAG: M56 family metallopeptidase [Clostridiales bacterium]|nr:M56 family metallopeptidase [Clostridiales bacterium]
MKFLILSCIFRILIPFEIPGFRYSSVDVIFCSDAEKLLYSVLESSFSEEFFPFLFFLWISGSICYSTRLFVRSKKMLAFIEKNSYIADSRAKRILEEMDPDCPAVIRICPMITRSYLTGYLHLNIYLPEYHYDEEELYYIILHEYTHWKRKDIWKKALMIFCCIVIWWNPAIHFMRKEVSQLLEFECDKYLAENLSDEEVMNYLDTLLNCIRNAQCSLLDRSLDTFASFIGTSKIYMSKHRFQLLIGRNAESRRRIFPKAVPIILDMIWLINSYYFIPR